MRLEATPAVPSPPRETAETKTNPTRGGSIAAKQATHSAERFRVRQDFCGNLDPIAAEGTQDASGALEVLASNENLLTKGDRALQRRAVRLSIQRYLVDTRCRAAHCCSGLSPLHVDPPQHGRKVRERVLKDCPHATHCDSNLAVHNAV